MWNGLENLKLRLQKGLTLEVSHENQIPGECHLYPQCQRLLTEFQGESAVKNLSPMENEQFTIKSHQRSKETQQDE